MGLLKKGKKKSFDKIASTGWRWRRYLARATPRQ